MKKRESRMVGTSKPSIAKWIFPLVGSLLRASHLGPTILVSSIAFAIARSQLNVMDAVHVTLAIFAGQLTVGWSNEVIDLPLDKEAQRTYKPLVSGKLSPALLKKLIPLALVSATLISINSPLGLLGTLLHLLGILSATAYNLRLKATVFSPIPYLISFGAMPWAIYLGAGESPPTWLYFSLGIFAVAFHFLNVLKDLEWDITQGVLGLPQRFGKTMSLLTAATLMTIGILAIVLLR